MNRIDNYRQDLTTHYLVSIKKSCIDKKKSTFSEKVKSVFKKVIKF